LRVRRLLLLLCAFVLLIASACGGEEEEQPAGGQEAPQEETAPEGGQPGQGGQEQGQAQVACPVVEAPQPKEEGDERRPRGRLPEGQYEATVQTSCGDFSFEIDTETSPRTAASFVELARNDFYQDTIFHRIVPGFVIQGGDPTGVGTGGPGYTTRDQPPEDARYVRGVVAMAKTGQEPPGTAGSQFFVVTGEDVGLPPDYAILGELTDGLDVVQTIGTLGDPADPTGAPKQPVVIEDITIEGP